MSVIKADMFMLNNKSYLCIVDYHSKFPVIQKAEDLSTDSLTLACKIICSEYGLPKKIISDAASYFDPDIFKQFCKKPSHRQATSSSYNHQSNGQVEACIKFIKCTIKSALILNRHTYSFITDRINSTRTRTAKPCYTAV